MDLPILETPRLLLRGFTTDDLDAFAAMAADPEVMRYIGPGVPQARAAAAERLAAAIYRWHYLGLPTWAVVRKTDGRFIGRCGLQPFAGSDTLEIAYGFIKEAWGQGYATEAGQAGLRFGFDTFGWARLIGRARPGNIASLRMLEKLGFRREAEITEGPEGPAVHCAVTWEMYQSAARRR